ncbi:hypothetical protein M0R04_09790 [Candidatus Dojkabacteria bacterium]|jgi:hypothetical protein|nr:hypothetical protein [Candidatus Dojkabacteria bacterium]
MNKYTLSMIGGGAILIGIIFLLFSINTAQTIVSDIGNVQDVQCTEFLTNAVNSQFTEGTWIALDIDNDDYLEYFKYTSRDLDKNCGTSSTSKFITTTDAGYKVYLSGTYPFICLPTSLGDNYKISYKTKDTKKDVKCIKCNEGSSSCIGYDQAVCVNNKFTNNTKQIGICGVECLKDYDCGYYKCIDYQCSTEVILDVKSLKAILDARIKEINSLQGTIQEKANLIKSLNLNIAEKSIVINNLNLNLQEKAELIDSLNLDIANKTALIKNLQNTISEKETIINNLNINTAEKTALINNLNSEVSALKTQLNNKNLELSDKIAIINQQDLTLTEKAELIDSLNLGIDQKTEIIESLELSNEEKENLIGELENDVATKIRMIEDLQQQKRIINYFISGIFMFFGVLMIGLNLLFVNKRK